MRILITGICGFAGSSLASCLAEAYPVSDIFGIDNFSRPGSETNREPLAQRGIRVVRGDVRSEQDLQSLPPADWVIDAAAYPSVLGGLGSVSSRFVVDTNVAGTVNLLEYCRQHGAGMVLLSTSRVYSISRLTALKMEEKGSAFRVAAGQELPEGVSPRGVAEGFSTEPPLSLYGSTKFASEILALEYGDMFGFPVRINRCGVLAGAGQFGRQDQGIFSYWLHAWRRAQPLSYHGFGGSGFQVRDCLHPRDLAALVGMQISSGSSSAPRVLNIGGGPERAISLANLSRWCAERFGAREVFRDPATHRFDIPWMVMDCSRAEASWGWKPETPLEDILEEIANHAEQNPRWLEISGNP